MDVELREKFHNSERIYYNVIKTDTREAVGYIELRFGHGVYLYYLGNIGYRIYEEFRGHSYAYKACVELLKLVKGMDLDYLIITASPENYASVRTIEKLPVEYIETVNVPRWHSLYRNNERVKKIYRINCSDL
ncbi:MAG: GNAT family N-acetyltransferase [Erysipelotrichaceae bacterium]|nr:GNAT family N-acetyltransferase [Erysipelotrichaceae bacterium]